MKVLGISALYHDSAAALVSEQKIIAAAQEERFTRKKHDLRIPKHAIEYCLAEGKIKAEELDAVVYYDNPIVTADRIMKNSVALKEESETINKNDHERFYRLIEAFKKETGCSVLINTSFNVRGEPIVCSPQDAYRCFMRTDMDILVLENCILYKENQPEFIDDKAWRDEYELD